MTASRFALSAPPAVLAFVFAGCTASDAAAPGSDVGGLGPGASLAAGPIPSARPTATSSTPSPVPTAPPVVGPPVDLCSLPKAPEKLDLSLPPPLVLTGVPTSLGLTGFSANARIQPRGAATTYHFEWGTTEAYGSKTAEKPLGPRLSAHYRETWNAGLAGWRGGSGTDLVFQPAGGVSGGFARYAEPTGIDYNHTDGIGMLHLVQYLYPGFFQGDAPTVALGGNDPDLRDAKVGVSLRGNAWSPRGSELIWWSQVDITHGRPPPDRDPAFSNWAHTGNNLTEHLRSGEWERAEYRLDNDTNAWTFAGNNSQFPRPEYVYWPLDEVLRHLDVDVFHLLAFIDDYDSPAGSIDFDDLEITYRNHSLLAPSNGGHVVRWPNGSDPPSTLTDGWRRGEGKSWKSAAFPASPQEIVYELERPVTVQKVQLHQSLEWPARGVEVLTSTDGLTWTKIVAATMAASADAGENFAYLLKTDLSACATMIKVRILDGYKAERWGLGEVEVFGVGARMLTDNDWYNVNADIVGLATASTIHHRVVVRSGGRTFFGPDVTYHTPADAAPEVAVAPASRIRASSAKLEGRINTLGREAEVYFEYGPDAAYGLETKRRWTGPEITPRTVVALVEGLPSGDEVHYRLVVSGPGGTTRSADQTFVAR